MRNLLLFFIIIFFISPVVSLADDSKLEERPPELVEAFNLIGSGQLDESIKICNDYIAKHGEDAYAYSCLGYAYNEKKEYLDAINALDKSLILMPGYAFARIQLGIANMELGNYTTAEEIFVELIEDEPSWEKTYYFLGNLKVMQKRDNEAIQFYTRAIAIKPEYIEALLERGKLYAELDRHDDAIKDFSEVINLAPDIEKGYLNRERSYSAKKEWRLVITDCDKLISLAPDDPLYYLKRSASYLMIDEFEKAKIDVKTALKMPGCPWHAYYLLILANLMENAFLSFVIMIIILFFTVKYFVRKSKKRLKELSN